MAVNRTHNVLLLEFEDFSHGLRFGVCALLKLQCGVSRVLCSAFFKMGQQFSNVRSAPR